MSSEGSARTLLRTATASHHRRVDDVFSRARLDSLPSYGQFLRAQAAAHLPAERALTEAGAAAIVPDWEQRRRGDLLLQDLAALQLDAPHPVGPLKLEGDAAILGALYVLEGSRLGGEYLKKSVPADFPARFLGGVDPQAWRRLLALLDERLVTVLERDLATKAACDVFTLFESSGQRYLRVS